MKIRQSILFLLAIVALLIAFMLWCLKDKPTVVPQAVQATSNSTAVAGFGPTSTVSPVGGTNVPALVAPTTQPSALPSKMDRALSILSTYNDVPIDFYGRIEDQFGNGVAAADVNFTVRIANGQKSGVERGQVISDGNGFFSITGYRGKDLGIMPTKTGYALASTDTMFKYSHLEDHPYVSDANNPTVVKMWKLQGAEPLVQIDKTYKLHYTDAPINFDLLTGEIVPTGGDIKITVNRSPGIISGQSRLDWGLKIEAVNGGLMDSGAREAVTYSAPENGYQANMAFNFSTNAPYKWAVGFNQGFFMMSRNGQVYTKLGLTFRINEAPTDFMYVRFGGVANANNSRNWEGDPNTWNASGK